MKSSHSIKILVVCLGLAGVGNVAAQATDYNGTLNFTGTPVSVSFPSPFGGTINGSAGIDLQRIYLGNTLSGTGVNVTFTTHNAFNPQGTVLALIFATDPNNAIVSNPANLASLVNPATVPVTFLDANVVGWQYFAFASAITSNGVSNISSLYTPMSFTAGTDYYAFVGGGSAIALNGPTNASVGYTLSINTTSPVPVPAAAWLLGSGLVGLFGLAHRARGRRVE